MRHHVQNNGRGSLSQPAQTQKIVLIVMLASMSAPYSILLLLLPSFCLDGWVGAGGDGRIDMVKPA